MDAIFSAILSWVFSPVGWLGAGFIGYPVLSKTFRGVLSAIRAAWDAFLAALAARVEQVKDKVQDAID